jgi:hypothetical protein
MSRGARPTLPAFDALVFARLKELREAAAGDSAADEDPPSGIVLRAEMLASVPRLAVTLTELMAMPLDHRAGFIASFVDGTFTIEMILDACAMPRLEAVTLLGELAARGVIVIS